MKYSLNIKYRIVAYWLFTVAFLLLCIVAIGGYTRLSNSGLSIVEWKPVTGVFYPVSAAEWDLEFAKYKNSPEYQQINRHINLSQFKDIYFVEYFHRLFGRILGIVFIVPMIYFVAKKYFHPGDIYKFVGIVLLGGAQGFAGWYMVSSGLVDDPRVSHFRLAVHLLMAVFIYGLIFWQGLNYYFSSCNPSSLFCHPGLRSGIQAISNRWILKQVQDDKRRGARHDDRSFHDCRSMAILLLTVALLQIFYGALVAGLDAGMVYGEFPLMGESVIPHEIYGLSLTQLLFYNPVSVQFIHRLIGITFLVLTLGFAYLNRDGKEVFKIYIVLMLLVIVQVLLGIASLLTQVQVEYALLHQVVAVLIISNLLLLLHYIIYRKSKI